MPMDRTRYPTDWDAISRAARERAGQKCEQCGVANGAVGARDDFGVWHDVDDIDGMSASQGDSLWQDGYPKIIRIVLTVHHVGVDKPDGTPGDPHDKQDCRPENLQALCQRCHLRADLPGHIERAKATRARKREQARAEQGEVRLF